ncbi:aspartate aminotransferase family protein [Litoribacillus peritrichatus]
MPWNELDAFWMPFTSNREFKSAPRMLTSAQGMHFTSDDGRKILDGTAGLWCVNAGHGREEIAKAAYDQLKELDFASAFQMGHPRPFQLAERLIQHTPEGLDHVFFTNSGSESVETALKIAVAYHRLNGNGSKTKFIGREKGYHGTNLGGISVGGLGSNRKDFNCLIPGVDHLQHTWIKGSEFTKGQPAKGAELADELESLIALHSADNIAAVIVEPVVGAGGVFIPPQGYLERLREITRQHDILLIFDEVITGFGRIGKPFAANRFQVTPDLLTTAKGLTNGAIPMGAVFAHNKIHQAFMNGPESSIELFHGYTYSGHPVASAVALATLDIYQHEGLFEQALALEHCWQEGLHSLSDLKAVKDIRNIGLIGAVELHPGDQPGQRGKQVFLDCYWQQNTLVRGIGDTLALSPPLIINEQQIHQLVEALRTAISKIPT